MASRVKQKEAARARAAEIRAQQQRAERRRRLLFAGLVVLAVLAIIAGLIVGGVFKKKPAAKSGAASASLISGIKLPASTFDTVGTGGVSAGPKKIDAPKLTRNGKPRVLYVGAEYCPYCAAERWAFAVALSRFGQFGTLGTTHSSSSDVFPDTATLSFHKATYSSNYLDFTGVETQSNQPSGGSYAPLDKLSADDQKIFGKYDAQSYTGAQSGSIPFIDIGGTYVSAGATYSPELLQGMTHDQIVAALKKPSSKLTQAIVGSANRFTAAICDVTGGKPANVCTSSGVKAAAG